MNNGDDLSIEVVAPKDIILSSYVETRHCEIVEVAHLPPAIRIDYICYNAIVAQEWVCPDGPGLIGELSKQWWIDRISRVPKSIDEALNFAWRLGRPNTVSVEVGSGTIRSVTYFGELGTIDGATSIFLSGVDREAERIYNRAIQSEYKDRKAGRFFGGSLVPECIPAWWRLTHSKNGSKHALTDPLDRNSITNKQKCLVKAVLAGNRRNGDTSLASNLCYAYTIEEPPLAEELFSRNHYYSEQSVMTTHRDAIIEKLRTFANIKWLDDIIEPRIKFIRTFPPENQHHVSTMLGIRATGRIFELMPEKWIPCVDLLNLLENNIYVSNKAFSGPFPFFPEQLKNAISGSINLVRIDLGLPRIGEGWVTEVELFYRVKALLPGEEVIHQGQPLWLGAQRFDIWIPGRNIAIEYHGEQHFSEISLFGGKAGLEATQARDARKRRLCSENGVELIEIAFDEDRSDKWLISRLALN